jgi:hypothetical protein
MIGKAFSIGKEVRKELRLNYATDNEIFEKFKKFKEETRWSVPKDSDVVALSHDEIVEVINNIEEPRFKRLCELMLDLETKGDIHKLNYEFFFGVPAAKVTKQQRQSSKAVTFGVIYGKSVNSLAKDLGCTDEEAQTVLNAMFEKFKQGKQFIDECYSNGLRKKHLVSPIGRVRHLDAYYNNLKMVQGATDRKGPNSIIQGFSSDLGFMGGKIMQDMCWDMFWSRGINLDFRYMNVVHDSVESQVRIRHIPIVSYLLEHAYTTQVHKKLRDEYGFELTIGFEQDQELGFAYSNILGFDNYCGLDKYVKQSIEGAKKELSNWTVEDNEYNDFLHNWKIMSEVRKKELENSLGKWVEYDMSLNKDNILNLGLII